MKALTILSLASVAAAIFLSTPVADARTWTSSDGSKTFSGELLSYDPGTGAVGVTLTNGKKMTFKQDKLSEEDIAYLKKNGAKTSGSSARIKKPSQNMAPVDVTKFKRPVKLACVGDSITQGVGAKRGQSWPDQLRAMLGDQWEVKNFGLSGTTLINCRFSYPQNGKERSPTTHPSSPPMQPLQTPYPKNKFLTSIYSCAILCE